MILLISTCSEKTHELEFVDSVKKNLGESFSKHYDRISIKDLDKADKVIICGTALQDNEYLKDLDKFEWLKEFKKPILGICSGMQIIGLIFGSEAHKKQEIGYYKENFKKSFLGLEGNVEVYHLHNNYISLPKNFKQFTDSEIPQAIKHFKRNIYGVLFHPEVRNEEMLKEFEKI